MQKSYNAVLGQSIYDVCLNTYGALDNLFKLLQDTAGETLGVNDVPTSGQAYQYDDALVADQRISQATTLAGLKYATYYGINGSSMYVVIQNPSSNIPGTPGPVDNPPPNPSTMQTLVDSASTISGADGTTVISLPDKNGGSLIGYDVIFVEREIRPIKRANWVWNTALGSVTLINGETLDKDQELFYIYKKTITA